MSTPRLNHQSFVVVGAGIVGLATGRALQRAHPGSQVTVLEKECASALHQTGRNSGVLHSGIYYRPGSLKAQLCTQGRRSMIAYAQEKGVAHSVTGKLIVATRPTELPRLAALEQRATEHGLTVTWVNGAAARDHEPNVAAIAALHVAETGIIDYVSVSHELERDIIAGGGTVLYGTAVCGITRHSDGVLVRLEGGEIKTDAVVNCAGLHADLVARSAGDRPGAQIMPFRGEYFEVRPERQHLVRALVYPVPDPELPFLGVHLTRMIDGQLHCGPNAVLALAREGYRWSNVDLRELGRLVAFPGAWRLARANVRTGIEEVARSISRRRFVKSLQRLVPEIRESDLVRAPAGVRAQAVARDGSLLDDFEIVRRDRIVHVINAPSPAATSSLVIGEHVAALISSDT